MTFIATRIKRLQELSRQRPMFRDIFDFHLHLYTFLATEREPFLAVDLNPEAERRKGTPLVTGESIEADGSRTAIFLRRLIAIFRKHGREGTEELDRLDNALAGEKLDLPRLLRACLDRHRRPLAEAAELIGVHAALLEYVCATALGYALKRFREENPFPSPEGWEYGYCPFCGGPPVMGELTGEEGRKMLHCGACGTSWEHTRLKCSYCGNADHDTQEYFTAGEERGYRVNVCRSCGCYLKLVDGRETGEGLPLDIEDIATLHLDLLAQQEGFSRGKKDSRAA